MAMRMIAGGAMMLVSSVTLSGCGTEASPREVAPSGAAVAADAATVGVWDREPELTWSLEPDLRIGAIEGDGPDVFGRIRGLIPDGAGGVWVYDRQAYELRHFDAEGRHSASVGRQGQGPGEFSGNVCVHPGADGEIWVETRPNWHRFDQAGQLLGTFPSPSNLGCAVRAWLPDGRYLVGNDGSNWETGEQRSYFVVLEWTDGTMTPVDTADGPQVYAPEVVIFVDASGTRRQHVPIPFSLGAGWLLEKNGHFWAWGGGSTYAIRLETLAGDTIRRISRDYAPVPVAGSVRRQAIADLQPPGWQAEPAFDASRVPSVYPPFSSVMLSADGSVWVRRQVGEGEITWEVFAEDDRYLGAVDMSDELEGLRVIDIGTDHVWGILQNELDVEYVIRARVVKPGG